MEKAIKILIYFHAAFGGIALLAGLLAIIAKKRKNTSKKSWIGFFLFHDAIWKHRIDHCCFTQS